MKPFLLKLCGILLFVLSQSNLFAQSADDYAIFFNNKKIIPIDNVTGLNTKSKALANTIFEGKHFVVMQFYSLPTVAEKLLLSDKGIALIDYLPNLAYTASVPVGFNNNLLRVSKVKSVFALSNAQKTDAVLLSHKVPTHAQPKAGYADVSILMFQYFDANVMAQSFKALQAEVLTNAPVFKMYTLRLPAKNLAKLVSMPYVQWAEYIAPPNVPENLPGRTLHRVNVISDGVRNLKGDGMNIGVWDENASPHIDFLPAGRMSNQSAGAPGSHGTHVSGTIGGKGIINPMARGMAPNANIFSYYGFSGDVQVAMASAIPTNTLISSNHSYHDGLGVQCGVTGASAGYSLRARNSDINLNNFAYHLHCHSSGNAQTSCGSGWGTITGTGKAAKNNVVVANITSAEAISGSSSFGPVHDGRVKPELSAMGTNVLSTYTPLNTYGTISGTSMSTPGITGTLALLAQRYKQLNANALPPSTLIKNIACNTAIDLGTEGPDYRFGFGRINALAAVKILEQNRYVLNTVATGSNNNVNITIPAGASKVNVMLTWNDPAAASNSSIALVNNLDLSVINGATVFLPWILNPLSPAAMATKATDNISNIEQVTITNPVAGNYTLKVNGTAITTGASQGYALSWNVDMPYIEITYPNGNEAFTPGVAEVITWDNAGVTTNQTVEYSLDNGASWTLISNSIPATTTRLNWSVPAANTATALIRISAGGLTDASDANFKILGSVTGFAVLSGGGCAAGAIAFTWNAVANANAYDIFKLNETTGDFVPQALNITTTTHTISGLAPGESGWYYIVAKNTTTNAVSMRSTAINAAASTNGGLGAVGNITGQSTVCGTTANSVYSIPAVAGASSYSWSVPAGVNIISGQGSTTLTVNFSASAVSGAISVFASNGTCQTESINLPITIGNASLVPPISAGNQSHIACPSTILPTLTASATTTTGNTLVWYNANIGGNIVANPTLSSVGSINYYAATKSISTGCESINRTMVALSISQVAPTNISASGSTTFCQAGNVTLTASPSSTWLWSNGATTQSIVVATSGSYTVSGTTGTCSSTSPATNVQVNSLPLASIAANGSTSICQGNAVLLSASNGASWLWSNGATTQSISATSTGNYSVVVNNAQGCSATSATTNVNVSPSPTVSISASPYTSLYPGLVTAIKANVQPTGSYTYSWYKNNVLIPGANMAELANINVNNLGSYTVTVTNSTGQLCSKTAAPLLIKDSASTTLFIYPSPNAGLFKISFYTPISNTKNSVVIYDAKGAAVYQKQYSLFTPYQTMDVNMQAYAKGTYRVVLLDVNGKKMATGAVVIL